MFLIYELFLSLSRGNTLLTLLAYYYFSIIVVFLLIVIHVEQGKNTMLCNFGHKRHLMILGVCTLLLGTMVSVGAFAKSPSTASVAPANAHHAIAVVPFEFDPGHTNTVEATWAPGQGDNTGGKNEALLLTKLTTTATNA